MNWINYPFHTESWVKPVEGTEQQSAGGSKAVESQ